jgi:predicted dehydrogenase
MTFADQNCNQMYLDEMKNFLDCVKLDSPTTRTPLSDGIEVLRIALAAKESSEQGKRVEL